MSLGYLIDVQGTLISDLDKSPLPGAVKFIDYLNENLVPYCVITNNTKLKSEVFLNSLKDKGLNIKYYLDPFMVLKKSLNTNCVAAFGPKSFIDVLKELEFTVDEKKADAVLIASDIEYDAKKLAKMISLVLNGAKIVGMHGTSIYAKDGVTYPGVGAILAMLKYATNKSATIVGKPSPHFYEKALQILQKQNPNITFNKITIISDDAKGDLSGAKTLGMDTKLVLTGKIKNEKEAELFKEFFDKSYPNLESILKELNERDWSL